MIRSTLLATAPLVAVLAAALLWATASAQAPPPGGGPQSGGPQSGGPPPQGVSGEPQGNGAGEGTPWPVIFVTGLDVVRAPHNGRDIIIAHGLVTSSTWRSPYLVPITQGKPADGVLDLLLRRATP
jgi:hypothetical protein